MHILTLVSVGLLTMAASAQSQFGLLEDLEPGVGSSLTASPPMVAADGLAWFIARQGGVNKLFVTNGTPGGTRAITPVGSTALVPYLDGVIFLANDAAHGLEPWVVDSGGAPRLLADLVPGPVGSGAMPRLTVGGSAWFLLSVNGAQQVVLARDGWWTPVNPPTGGWSGVVLETGVRFGDRLLCRRGADLVGIWPSGGSVIAAGQNLAPAIVVGSECLLVGGTTDIELWRTDGTTAGTRRLVNINPSGSSSPDQFVPFGQGVMFTANGGPTVGRELYRWSRSNGFALVRDVAPGSGSSNPDYLRVAENKVFFLASAGTGLWASDGTAPGTVQVSLNGAVLQPLTWLEAVGDTAYFPAWHPVSGLEWWSVQANSQPLTAFLVADVNLGLGSGAWPCGSLVAAGPEVVGAFLGPLGRELYVMDRGTSSATLGIGCGDQTRNASVRSSDPRVGAAVTMEGTDAAANAVAMPFFSLPQIGSIPVAGDCRAYVSPATAAAGSPVLATNGSWNVVTNVPLTNALIDVRLITQTLLFPSSSPNGFDLTNAIQWRIGQ